MAIVRPTITYGSEVLQHEPNKNKVLTKICGHLFDDVSNRWRKSKNIEIREITKITVITSYVKGQKQKMV